MFPLSHIDGYRLVDLGVSLPPGWLSLNKTTSWLTSDQPVSLQGRPCCEEQNDLVYFHMVASLCPARNRRGFSPDIPCEVLVQLLEVDITEVCPFLPSEFLTPGLARTKPLAIHPSWFRIFLPWYWFSRMLLLQGCVIFCICLSFSAVLGGSM